MLILKYYFFVNKTNYSSQLPNRGFNHKIKNSTIRYPMRLQCRNCLHEMWEDLKSDARGRERVLEEDRVRMEEFPVPSSLTPSYFSLYPTFSLATPEATDDRLQPRYEVIKILNIYFLLSCQGRREWQRPRLRENKEDHLRPDM